MVKRADEEAVSILQAILALGRRLRSERPEGAVTLSAISLLGTLRRLGPMSATKLAAEERLQPQSLTRMVARLEKDGLIERQRSRDDRRAVTIALTEKGRSVLAEDLRSRLKWLQASMAEALSDEERASLIAAAGAMQRLAFHKGTKSD